MKQGGGAAYPIVVPVQQGPMDVDPGMTKRQWYKGMALKSGMCPHNAHDIHAIVSWSGAIADAELADDAEFAMLAEDAAREGEDE